MYEHVLSKLNFTFELEDERLANKVFVNFARVAGLDPELG